jgi:2-polyprenyl-3-methyl-5-hydroxy-6-metoxy-1,4-benzoquinol methylase
VLSHDFFKRDTYSFSEPIMTNIDKVRELTHRLIISTETLSALGVAIEMQIGGTTLTQKLQAQVKEITRVLGVGGELEGTSKESLGALLAEIRIAFLNGTKRLHSSTIQPGWTHSEEAILRSYGQTSAGIAPMLKRMLIPKLEGLGDRLESVDASFLDIGVGVAELSIAVAHQWPNLRVVGIDPWEPALKIARENVARAGLGDRIELRRQTAEELVDNATFDLVWFPALFIHADQITPALQHVQRSLMPGGWVISGTINKAGEPLEDALADLRTIYLRGEPLSTSELEGQMKESGFDPVQVIPSPPWSASVLVVGRRPT